jgi:signal transduction histidine kinase
MRFNIFLSFCLIFACHTTYVFGQKTLNFPEFTEGASIKPYLELSDVYDKNDTALVLKGEQFTPFSPNQDASQYETNKKGCTWFRFKIDNNLPTDTAMVLAFWDYTDWMEGFIADGDTLRLLGLVGEMAPIHRTSFGTDKVGMRLPLKAGSESVFYLRSLNYYGYATFKLPKFYTSVTYFKHITAWQFGFKIPACLVIGIFLSQIVFLIVRMVTLHQFQLSYFLYILCCFNFTVFIVFQSQLLNFDGEEFASGYGGTFFCGRFGALLYGLFYIFFLELYTKSRWRFWAGIVFSGLVLIVSIVGLVVAFRFEGDAVQYYCVKIQQIFNLTIFAVALSYLIVNRQGAARFILYGILALFVAFSWTLFISYFDRNYDLPVFLHHHLIMMYGVVVESFFFITALLRRDGEIKAERHQQITNERNRIAYDLHDDLGTGLTTIRLLGERAQKDIENAEKKTQIQKITHEASDLIEKMSTIIWVMNSENDTVESMVNYLRRYAFDYLQETHNLKLSFPLPDLPPSVLIQNFNGDDRREVFLTVKEALHNIVKHAEATAVSLSISLENKDLEIIISDNGKGLNGKNTMGNGLKSMANRMEKLDGKFQISSKVAGGTQVFLGIPLTKVKMGF